MINFGPSSTVSCPSPTLVSLVNKTHLNRNIPLEEHPKKCPKYQPSGKGGTCSPPATPHRLQNPIWPPGGPITADGITGKKRKRLMIIVATTSLPAVDCPNADRWNAARSCQFESHLHLVTTFISYYPFRHSIFHIFMAFK